MVTMFRHLLIAQDVPVILKVMKQQQRYLRLLPSSSSSSSNGWRWGYNFNHNNIHQQHCSTGSSIRRCRRVYTVTILNPLKSKNISALCHRHTYYMNAVSSSFRTISIAAARTIQPRNTDISSIPASNNNNNNVRLSKFIATCMGISRKDVERHIKDGNVTLYGKVITSSAMMISYSEISQPNNVAALMIQKKTVPVLLYHTNNNTTIPLSSTNDGTASQRPNNKVRVWLVHKMAGELVTDIDPYRRPTVMSRIHKLGKYNKVTKRNEHIKIVGRLDMNTEGLLVVTNCGLYARQLELSKNMLHRIYRVRVHGRPLVSYQINMIQNGQVVIDSIHYPPMKVAYDTKSRKNTTATNQWMTITCTQGKNRQIRKVLQYFHCTVTRLIRISYGDYNLGTIPKGMVQEVTNNNDGNSNSSGIIPYQQHVRRGKLLTGTTQKSKGKRGHEPHQGKRGQEPPQQSTPRGRTVTTKNNDTKPMATHAKRKRTASSSSSSLPSTPHRPVQWIRM